jgi:ABC-2 type transport system permease protein
VHGIIAGEKEEGTLRLLVSTGAPRDSILLGKLFGSFSAFAIPVGCGVILGIVVMLGSPIVRAHLGGQIPALVIALFFVFALICLLFLLATFVSMFAHRSGVAIVLLLFLWVFLVLALPRMAPMIAQIIYPAKPHNVVELEKRLVKTSGDLQFLGVADSLYRTVLGRHGFDADTLDVVVPQNLTGELKTAHDEYEREFEGVEASYKDGIHAQWRILDSTREQAYASQERLSSFITRLSPMGTFSALASTLAGTGLIEWSRSLDFAREFQGRVTMEWYSFWVVRPYGANRSITMPAGGRQAVGSSCPQVMEKRKLLGILAPASTADRLKASTPDMLVLAGMTLFAGAGCWFKFRSYDVR